MTEEKSKVELEKMSKRVEVVAVIGLALLLVGAGIALWSLISIDDKMLPDNEHITDQGMPIRDLENATYTWTSEEIEQMAKEKLDVLTLGAFLIAPGTALLYGIMFLAPSKRKLHEINCNPGEDYLDSDKYCPECGLKLEKKG
jgi:hypothetical protein